MTSPNATRLYLYEPGHAEEEGRYTRYASPSASGCDGTTPDAVTRLHINFNGRPDSGLVTTGLAYAMTEELASDLLAAGLTGVATRPMKATRSLNFRASFPRAALPVLLHLVPTGRASYSSAGEVLSWSGHDVCWGHVPGWTRPEPYDFSHCSNGLIGPSSLVVSETCLSLLLRRERHLFELGGLARPQGGRCGTRPSAALRALAAYGTPDRLYEVDPGWLGRVGERTTYDEPDRGPDGLPIPRIAKLQWVIDRWPSADIVRCGSAFLVSSRLADALTASGLTGFGLEPVEPTWDGTPPVPRPAQSGVFVRLLPEGRVSYDMTASVEAWSGHDICWAVGSEWDAPEHPIDDPRGFYPLTGPYALMVSWRCLLLLLEFDIGVTQVAARQVDLGGRSWRSVRRAT